jgi:hypothetical protein
VRRIQGVRALAKKFGTPAVNKACALALEMLLKCGPRSCRTKIGRSSAVVVPHPSHILVAPKQLLTECQIARGPRCYANWRHPHREFVDSSVGIGRLHITGSDFSTGIGSIRLG